MILSRYNLTYVTNIGYIIKKDHYFKSPVCSALPTYELIIR